MLSSRVLKCKVLLGFGLLSLGLLAGCDRQSREKAQPEGAGTRETAEASEKGSGLDRSHKGSAMPDYVLNDFQGHEVEFASLKGKPVLLNLWATWCAPCIAELPLLDKLAAARGDELHVIAVSQDSAKPAQIAAFLTQHGISTLKPWQDPESDLAFQYGGQDLPVTVYYGSDGKELWRYAGGRDWGSAETAKLLAEATRP